MAEFSINMELIKIPENFSMKCITYFRNLSKTLKNVFDLEGSSGMGIKIFENFAENWLQFVEEYLMEIFHHAHEIQVPAFKILRFWKKNEKNLKNYKKDWDF